MRKTGFETRAMMIGMIVIICNGDHDKMISRRSSLTWFEEWFFYFEFKWGRTITRWVDAKAVYKKDMKGLLVIFKSKVSIALQCRERWPRFVSFDEDHTLMKQTWKDKYKDKRIIMWDDTNVNFCFMPSGADEQRLTYSMYYAGNCAKGGVFLQLCGWTGVENLWVGATSDSHYQEHTNIFEKQNRFAKNDLVYGQLIPFTNIFDKGYRVNLPAWRAGRQQVIQPTFAKSDCKFSGRETLHTASVASDRSANERAVNRCKQSGYIQRGLKQNGDPTTMDDVWLTWSFQTNFMYNAVL